MTIDNNNIEKTYSYVHLRKTFAIFLAINIKKKVVGTSSTKLQDNASACNIFNPSSLYIPNFLETLT